MKKFFSYLATALICCLCLTGCLSHWFIDTDSRLQVENATENCTLLSLDIYSMENDNYQRWISETLLPGERSRVVQNDWVGKFTLRVNYTESVDGSGEVKHFLKKMDVEGGSLFLKVESDGDSLSLRFR